MPALRIAAALSTAVVLLAGCGVAPNTGRVATPERSEPGRADTTQQLASAINAAGVPCMNYEEIENPVAALGRGSCYVGSDQVLVSVYESRAAAAAEPQRKANLLGGMRVIMVVGENWTAACDSVPVCQSIEGSYGGRLVVVPA
jgi:hypothetical protein